MPIYLPSTSTLLYRGVFREEIYLSYYLLTHLPAAYLLTCRLTYSISSQDYLPAPTYVVHIVDFPPTWITVPRTYVPTGPVSPTHLPAYLLTSYTYRLTYITSSYKISALSLVHCIPRSTVSV